MKKQNTIFLFQRIVKVQVFIILGSLFTFFITTSFSQIPVAHLETTGNYSGIFYSQYPIEMGMQPSYKEANFSGIVIRAMYPAKHFGWGIEVPYKRYQFKNNGTVQSFQVSGWGDIILIAKYQFGIYRKFNLLGSPKLFKGVASLIGKLKLNSAATNLTAPDGELLSPYFQPGNGSKSLSLALSYRSDTEKYFWIHSHFMVSLPVTHKNFLPGITLNSMVKMIFARISIADLAYPFIHFRYWQHLSDKLQSQKIARSEGAYLYICPGIKSIWGYFCDAHIALMTLAEFQFRTWEKKNSMPVPDFAFLLGTYFFVR